MIHIIGLGPGDEPLFPAAARILAQADKVAGGARLLNRLNVPEARQLPFTTVEEFAVRIREQQGQVCVVADGDPLLYGIGATLLRFFPASELIFHPHVSALQSACARFGLAWHDCAILSLHGRSDLGPLFAALTHRQLIALFTDSDFCPARIARALIERGVAGWRMHVAERLHAPHERTCTLTLSEAADLSWMQPNIVLLERITHPEQSLRLGIPDCHLLHDQGLLTKEPVRALSLSLLELAPDSLLWDLGAGSGALSLEAARLLTQGQILAVERNARRIGHIRANIARFGAWNVQAMHADLEDFLTQYGQHPAPTHIFLGGGASPHTLPQICARLLPGGRLTVTAVLLSTLHLVRATLDNLGWTATIHQLMHHASAPLGQDLRLVPSNPIFVISARKPNGKNLH